MENNYERIMWIGDWFSHFTNWWTC